MFVSTLMKYQSQQLVQNAIALIYEVELKILLFKTFYTHLTSWTIHASIVTQILSYLTFKKKMSYATTMNSIVERFITNHLKMFSYKGFSIFFGTMFVWTNFWHCNWNTIYRVESLKILSILRNKQKHGQMTNVSKLSLNGENI